MSDHVAPQSQKLRKDPVCINASLSPFAVVIAKRSDDFKILTVYHAAEELHGFKIQGAGGNVVSTVNTSDEVVESKKATARPDELWKPQFRQPCREPFGGGWMSKTVNLRGMLAKLDGERKHVKREFRERGTLHNLIII